MQDENELPIVYAGSMIDAGFVKNLLEGNGIEAFLQDEFMRTPAPISTGAVKVMVVRGDLETAESLVKEFLKGQTDESAGL